MASPQVHDVLIIGGGPSGLAIATGLARQLHTAIVFDSNIYRNRMTSHMHNVITWDHQDPREFRWKAREDIVQRYDTISFKDGTTIESVRKNEAEYFEARDSTGEVWLGRKLALAMGVRDVYPKIEGYGECWGSGIFNCLFCHGYEDRGCNSAGILAIDGVANPKVSLQLARMAKRLAKDVTVYTNGSNEVGDQISAALSGSGSGIKIINSRISKLAKGPTKAQVTITFEDGNEITEGFLVHKPTTSINGPFAHQLSLELTEQGDIKTSQPFYESSVPGVFAVGDCANPLKVVATAVTMGTLAAAGLAIQLQIEEVR